MSRIWFVINTMRVQCGVLAFMIPGLLLLVMPWHTFTNTVALKVPITALIVSMCALLLMLIARIPLRALNLVLVFIVTVVSLVITSLSNGTTVHGLVSSGYVPVSIGSLAVIVCAAWIGIICQGNDRRSAALMVGSVALSGALLAFTVMLGSVMNLHVLREFAGSLFDSSIGISIGCIALLYLLTDSSRKIGFIYSILVIAEVLLLIRLGEPLLIMSIALGGLPFALLVRKRSIVPIILCCVIFSVGILTIHMSGERTGSPTATESIQILAHELVTNPWSALFGSGPGSFPQLWENREFGIDTPAGSQDVGRMRYAHNLLLTTILEYGLCVILFYLAAVISVLALIIERAVRTREDAKIVLGGMVLAVLLACAVGNPGLAVLCLASLLWGTLYEEVDSLRFRGLRIVEKHSVSILNVILFFTTCFVVSTSAFDIYLRLSYDRERAVLDYRSENERERFPQLVALSNLGAIESSRWIAEEYRSLMVRSLQGDESAKGVLDRLDKKAAFNDLVNAIDKLVETDTHDLRVWILNTQIHLLLQLFSTDGVTSERHVKELIQSTLKRAPGNPLAYAAFADIFMTMRRPAEAVELYSKALELNPSSVVYATGLDRAKSLLQNMVAQEAASSMPAMASTSMATSSVVSTGASTSITSITSTTSTGSVQIMR